MSAALSELRRVFEAATANVDKASFPPCRSRPKIFSPCWPSRVLRAIARARRFGASNCRREWRISFGKNFHDVAVSGAEGTDD